MQRLEAAFHRAWPQWSPHAHRRGNAFEVFDPNVLQLEQISEKPASIFGYDDHVRRCDALQPRR